MAVNIINHCKKGYRPDPEKIVSKILEKIPAKFLSNLGEIHLFDLGEKEYPMMKYVQDGSEGEISRIEIYMDNSDFSGLPFFSILSLNVHFIIAINEHIEKYLKQQSKDKEVLSYSSAMANYDWMYLGVWSPLLVVIKVFNYLFSKIKFLRSAMLRWTNKLIKNVKM